MSDEIITDTACRAAYGKLAGRVGILCNVLLCGGKFAVGMLSGSLSITADAVNNLSDASSGIISLIGFKLSEKSADKEHPYGHGRYEYLAGFIVAAIILAIGFDLLHSGIMKIVEPTPVEFGALPLAVLGISIAVKIWLMLFYLRIGRKIRSDTLTAAAADSRNDVISTSAVLLAFALSHFCNINLDGIMSVLVAAFVLVSGIGLIREAMNPLLGKAPQSEQVEEIRRKILSYDKVLGTHDLMIHDYGPGRQFASVHVEVSSELSLVDCHEIIDKIEQDFLSDGLPMLVHPDPVVRAEDAASSEMGRICSTLSEIVKSIDSRITVHDVRIVPAQEIRKVIFDCVVPAEVKESTAQLEEKICGEFRKAFSDCECIISFESSFASIPKSPESIRAANMERLSKKEK